MLAKLDGRIKLRQAQYGVEGSHMSVRPFDAFSLPVFEGATNLYCARQKALDSLLRSNLATRALQLSVLAHSFILQAGALTDNVAALTTLGS